MLRRRKNLPFHANADSTYTVGLDQDSRDFLADLPQQLMVVIAAGDEESTRRLFPPAYHRDSDAERQEEYQRFMRDDLVESKRAALTMLSETAHLERLTHDQMIAWMGAVNDIRLVLGTQIDVYEGLDLDDLADDDPRRPALAVYGWLSGILELIVMGLTSDAPEATDRRDPDDTPDLDEAT